MPSNVRGLDHGTTYKASVHCFVMKHGYSALMIASEFGRESVVTSLLEHKARVNSLNKVRATIDSLVFLACQYDLQGADML